MDNIIVHHINNTPVHLQPVEIVERKGVGHPDTICNSIVDQVSIEYSKHCLKRFGVVPHHNFDKALLGAGHSSPQFGGGFINKPAQFILGDRATTKIGDDLIHVNDIAEVTVRDWLKNNMRFFHDVKFSSVISEGSGDLKDIFARKQTKFLPANDTSASIGYAPFTPFEETILKVEQYLSSRFIRENYPEVGEDIKLMGIRYNGNVDLTVSIAMIDKFLVDERDYFNTRSIIQDRIRRTLKTTTFGENLDVSVHVNALDVQGRGINGIFLTCTGTSAECGDSGQVGRGNNPVGLIPMNRPMSVEAAAGKNSVSHIGKIYNHLCFRMANEIYDATYVDEVYVRMVSRIGTPINEPSVVDVSYIVDGKEVDSKVESEAKEIVQYNLDNMDKFCKELINGSVRSV